jgi:hypothetical protein
MDKLEHYLDQVCRSIGGPRSLRQHIRQELGEHLRDAVAEHRAAGMSPEEALNRALADFGGPEQVRAELEATHGHRLLPVVIDKAMQWKEKTMKAKWLWMTWAHLVLVLVIALEVLTLTLANVFLVPRFEKLTHDGLIDPAVFRRDEVVQWIPSFLAGLRRTGDYTTWLLLGVAVAWGLFEWRVRGENKSFMRLSALGTAAVGLMVAVVLTMASLTLPFFLSVPGMAKVSAQLGSEQMASIDTSVSAIERAIPNKDWEAMQEQANRASRGVDTLANAPFALQVGPWQEKPTADDLRERLKAANESLWEAQRAIEAKDVERLEAALREFRQSYGPVREAAKKPER